MENMRKRILQYNFKKKILLNFKILKEIDDLSNDGLQNEIHLKLKNILLHARKNTGYYKKVISSSVINKEGILDLTEFEKIPFLEKKDIKKNFEQIIKKNLNDSDGWFKNTSGGSTGEPAVFIQDNDYVEWRTAVKILFDYWTGYTMGKKKVVIWAAERDLNTSKNNYLKKLKEFIKGEYALNAYQMSENDMNTFIKVINKKKPYQILSYAESIYELARYILGNNLKVFSPGAIMTSAGTLTEEMRKTVESAFNTKVYNRYGSREVGDIASECHMHSMHISSFTNYLEVVREDGSICDDGELGEIVVTSLTNYSMPLIRYKIGDVGAMTSVLCKCGKPHKVLQKLEGRTTDNFVKKDGTKVYGGAIRQVFYHKDWIQQYQIIQENLDEIILKIVSTEKQFSKLESNLIDIEKEIKKIMGSEVLITINLVDKLNSLKNGKFRFTISKVK